MDARQRFLEGRSRVIALADYKVEKAFVVIVPQRVLIGEPEGAEEHAAGIPAPAKPKRRLRGCPF